MKIKPTDPSSPGFPVEPQKAEKKTQGDFSVETSPAIEQAAGTKVKKSEIADSLKGLTSKDEIGERFIDVALQDFESVMEPAEIASVRSMLQEQIGEDPYLQEKLERITGLLSRAK